MSDSDDLQLRRRIEHARSDSPARGGSVLKRLRELVLWFDRAVESLVPARYNPFGQTGAIAIVSFVVSAITGILLLVWYRPSVHQAYESVLAMEASTIGAFLRSLHRYSSDICIFFVLIHALRLLFDGRFTGARWLAWVSGIAMIGLLWFIGWTGYMLVWDQPAGLVAAATASFLDVLPIFSEPISASFLAEELVPSLLFFVVFFTHMLLPLAIAAGIWIHVSRVQRPRLVPSRELMLWTVGTMVVLSLAVPATAQDPALLGINPGPMEIDYWYLAPLWLTDRLGAGMIWTLLAISTALLVGLPWMLGRRIGDEVADEDHDASDDNRDQLKATTRHVTASINSRRCNGCTLCARDCPYDAIVMVPTDEGRYDLKARLDPQRCVGCGICAGACNPGGIGLDWLPVQAMRRRFDRWIDEFCEESESGEGPVLAFLCADSAAAHFEVDPETGRCDELPGFRVVGVPCTGWVQPLTIERALRRGAAGVLVVGCTDTEPHFREGNDWTKRRLSGTRKPAFRREQVDASRVGHVTFDRTRPEALLESARQFRAAVTDSEASFSEPTPEPMSTGRTVAGGLLITTIVSAIVVLGSSAPYPGPPERPPQLVVSLNHYGQETEECEPIPEAERRDQPAHMQQDQHCERGRADVTIEAAVDGEIVFAETYSPRGIAGDGPAVAMKTLELEPGDRDVTLRIDDNDDGDWNHTEDWNLEFRSDHRHTLLFDTDDQFRHVTPDN